MSKHTLNIFKHLLDNLPPLFPDDISSQMKLSIGNYENQDDIKLEELEKEMIKYGYLVWPYRQAHSELMEKVIDEMGDHFFEPQLNEKILEKYHDFKGFGGSWRDLYSGKAADFFEHDERVDITAAMVEAKNKLQQHVANNIHSTDKDQYLKRVSEYNEVLDEIKMELDELRAMAENEDHESLSEQITSKIEDIEFSIGHLGKELQYHEIFNVVEFFRGRKNRLSRLRGIDIAKQIDFYAED